MFRLWSNNWEKDKCGTSQEPSDFRRFFFCKIQCFWMQRWCDAAFGRGAVKTGRVQADFGSTSQYDSWRGRAVLEVARGGRQNSGFLLCFCLLRGSRGTILDSAVEHFFFFSCFCSTFSSAWIDLAEDVRPGGTAMHGKWRFGTHGHSFLAVVQLHPNRSHQSPAFYKNITSCFKYWISLK